MNVSGHLNRRGALYILLKLVKFVNMLNINKKPQTVITD